MRIHPTPSPAVGLLRSRHLKLAVTVGLSACYFATFVLLLPPTLDPRPVERIAILVTALLTAAAGVAVIAFAVRRWNASPSTVICLMAAPVGVVLAGLHLPGPDSGLPQGIGWLAIAVLAVCVAVCLAPSPALGSPADRN